VSGQIEVVMVCRLSLYGSHNAATRGHGRGRRGNGDRRRVGGPGPFIYRSHECSVMQTCYHRGRRAGC
jgi:hypothetical protein